jgi:hypothetical protein
MNPFTPPTQQALPAHKKQRDFRGINHRLGFQISSLISLTSLKKKVPPRKIHLMHYLTVALEADPILDFLIPFLFDTIHLLYRILLTLWAPPKNRKKILVLSRI